MLGKCAETIVGGDEEPFLLRNQAECRGMNRIELPLTQPTVDGTGEFNASQIGYPHALPVFVVKQLPHGRAPILIVE
jgi:hypothetical protein